MPIKERQNTNTQHAVPQNIMDVEFKLIGDLTMRQFTYLVVFGLIAYLIFITVGGIFKWPFVIFFSILGLALAFIPLQERGMDEWVVNFFKSVYSPTQRIWRKGIELPVAFAYQSAAVVKHELVALAPTSSRRRLEEYLDLQQQSLTEDKLDIPEREYIYKVRQAFIPVASAVDIDENPKYTTVIKQSTPIAVMEEKAKIKPQPVQDNEKDKSKKEPSAQVSPSVSEDKKEHREVPAPKEEFTKRFPSIIKIKKESPLKIQSDKIPDDFMLSPMTPDMHSGRKFTRMLPAEGQLILPVRGEKIIETKEEENIQKDINEKTEQLKKLLDQIKLDKNIPATYTPVLEEKGKQEIKQAEDVVKKVKEDNEKLSNEIVKLKSEIEKSQTSEEEKKKGRQLLEKLEQDKERAGADYSALQKQVLELQNRLKEKEATLSAKPVNVNPTFSKMQPITNEPNIVSGIIKDEKGTVIAGVVLLIKNHKGESVRALKTNTIGQFSISTPLVNGVYTLEIGTGIQGLTFDIITIDVKGEIIPPIELMGRKV